MNNPSLIIIALVAALSSTAIAGIPVDSVTAQLQEHANITQGEIENKVVEHIVQGNLTEEHIAQDVNATKAQLKKEAAEHISQGLNTTADQVSQMAKQELQSQLNEKAKQPGFEYVLALSGIIGAALLLRRRL